MFCDDEGSVVYVNTMKILIDWHSILVPVVTNIPSSPLLQFMMYLTYTMLQRGVTYFSAFNFMQ